MNSPAEQPWPSPRRAWYALCVLTVGLMVATIDRSILSLLVGPFKHDLGVSDTRMSLLLGMAFVSIYAFLGLPIARLADVSSRRRVIGTVHPWQLAFFAVGLPGLALALVMATVREPARRGLMTGTAFRRSLPLNEIFAFLNAERSTYGPIFLAMGIKTLLSFGMGAWTPTFFVRTYGWTMPTCASY